MDIDIEELEKYSQQISSRELIKKSKNEFNRNFHNVGNLNIQSFNNKQTYRIIRRFDGISIKCFNLNLWKKINFKNNFKRQFSLEDMSIEINKEQLNGIYSNDKTGIELIKFLSFSNPLEQLYSTYEIYINDYKIDNIHKYSRLISYISNQRYFDKYKTPRQIFKYFAHMNGFENSSQFSQEIIEIMGLQGCALTQVNKISNGQYKRCQIGAEIIRQPKGICLEDPFKDLLYHEKLDLIQILKKLSERGLTVIFTFNLHSIQFLKQLDNIIILYNQKKYFDGNLQQLKFNIQQNIQDNIVNINPLIQFVQNIDTLRFKFINEDQSTYQQEYRLEKFKKKSEQILQYQQRQDQIKKQNYLNSKQIQQTQQKIVSSLKIKKQKISFLQSVYYIFLFKFKTYFINGLLQVNTIVALLIYVFCMFNIIFKVSPQMHPLAFEQNLSGGMFTTIFGFYLIGIKLNTDSLKDIYYQYLNYESLNKLYSKSVFITVIELLSLSLNIIFGTTAYLLGKTYFGNWFSFRQTFYGWISFVFVTMLVARDISFFIIFFLKKKSYDNLSINILFINFLTIGYLVQIKSITWIFRWITFLFPLRNVYQGIIMNTIINRIKLIKNCRIQYEAAKEEFCNPYSFHNFYEDTIGLNFMVFICVFIFYKILFLILFYIFSRKKYITKVNSIL